MYALLEGWCDCGLIIERYTCVEAWGRMDVFGAPGTEHAHSRGTSVHAGTNAARSVASCAIERHRLVLRTGAPCMQHGLVTIVGSFRAFLYAPRECRGVGIYSGCWCIKLCYVLVCLVYSTRSPCSSRLHASIVCRGLQQHQPTADESAACWDTSFVLCFFSFSGRAVDVSTQAQRVVRLASSAVTAIACVSWLYPQLIVFLSVSAIGGTCRRSAKFWFP